jgi:hypothetical protein
MTKTIKTNTVFQQPGFQPTIDDHMDMQSTSCLCLNTTTNCCHMTKNSFVVWVVRVLGLKVICLLLSSSSSSLKIKWTANLYLHNILHHSLKLQGHSNRI